MHCSCMYKGGSMNFLGMNKVIANLKAGKVRSIDQLWYLIFGGSQSYYLINMLKQANSNTNCDVVSSQLCLVNVLLVVAMIVFGLAFLNLYWINSRRDDQDFILRYVTLNATIGWRLILVCLSLIIILGLVAVKAPDDTLAFLTPAGVIPVVATIVTSAVHYILITLAFMEVAGKKRKNVSF